MHKYIYISILCFITFYGNSQSGELEHFLNSNNHLYDSLLKQHPTQTYLEPKSSSINKDSLNYFKTDTIYFDKDWIECEKISALYYRLIIAKENVFIINDYYLNGILQMTVPCTSLNPEIKNGIAIYYYPNGKRKSKGSYINNKPVGVWNYYNTRGWLQSNYDYSAVTTPPIDSASFKPINQSSILVANAYYRYKFNKGIINTGNGFGIEIGLNIGYFFNQRLLVAPFVGLNFRDQLYNTKFSTKYLNDFNNSFNGTNLTGNDSVVVNYIAKEMNTKNGSYHEHGGYFGLLIKLPFKYAPIMKVYKGQLFLLHKSGYHVLKLEPTEPTKNYSDHSYIDISRKMNWGVELFLYNGHTRIMEYERSNNKKRKLYWCRNAFAVSLYLEEFNIFQSSFSYDDGIHSVNVPMQNFMTSSFMSKYKKDYAFGIRLSFGVF